MTRYSWMLTLSVFLATAHAARADFITLTSSHDNTLIQVPSIGSAQLSNGANQGIFVGRTAQDPINGPPKISDRRGLLMFDLSSIPTGSHINSATLTLQLTTGNFNTAETIELHTVLNAWGEGTSSGGSGGGAGAAAVPPDATWFYSKYSSNSWTAPGGDSSPTVSASLAFNPTQPLGAYTWSGGTLAQDVQAWVDGTAANDGWLLLGNESVGQTARRFGSRESTTPPILDVDFAPPVALVPVPPSLILLGTGSIGMALATWRSRVRRSRS
jgi:hypothetical protein